VTEKELASVKVSEEDIQLVASQFDLDVKSAERALRENRGDAAETLRSLLYK